MSHRILLFYGSYRSDRMGIRLAQFVVEGLRGRGDDVELIDARAVGLPMLDRMYKEYPKGAAPAVIPALNSVMTCAQPSSDNKHSHPSMQPRRTRQSFMKFS